MSKVLEDLRGLKATLPQYQRAPCMEVILVFVFVDSEESFCGLDAIFGWREFPEDLHGIYTLYGIRNTPPEKKTVGKSSFWRTKSGGDGSFCCWITGQKLEQKECFFTDTGMGWVERTRNMRNMQDSTGHECA